LSRRQAQSWHLSEFASNAIENRRDALVVMMRADWCFDSPHDLAANDIDMIDSPAT
jgi:hypothetical protein